MDFYFKENIKQQITYYLLKTHISNNLFNFRITNAVQLKLFLFHKNII